ncbi:MAG: CIA30 family protein, partial [Caulobacterales bacterium]
VPGGGAFDGSELAGMEFDVAGNGETYGCHLRTTDTLRPWQSYRHSFVAGPAWTKIRLPFAGFEGHRIDIAFDARKLRRIGLVAIGRAFEADLSVSRLVFYRDGEQSPECGRLSGAR